MSVKQEKGACVMNSGARIVRYISKTAEEWIHLPRCFFDTMPSSGTVWGHFESINRPKRYSVCINISFSDIRKLYHCMPVDEQHQEPEE